MCSSFLKGTIWTGPARGRKKGQKTKSQILYAQEQQQEKQQQIEEHETLIQQSSEIDLQGILDAMTEKAKQETISEFSRTVYFQSNCKNKEKTYLYNIIPGSYYYCSQCHDYHQVRNIG